MIAADLADQLRTPRLRQLEIDGRVVRVTSPERVLWPASEAAPACTKRDLLQYFVQVASTLLTYLQDRPLTLNRFPTGITGKHWFQKHVETPIPWFVEHECLYAEEHDSSGEYVLCNNLPTLIWLGQIANLELHPWHSRTAADAEAKDFPRTFSGSVAALEGSVLNYPDVMVFDLDPYVYRNPSAQQNLDSFRRTSETAQWLREVLDELSLRTYVKTSGKTGLHIFVPLVRRFDYDTVRRISGQICAHVLRQHPDSVTMEWSVERRWGKVFLDYNQNTRGKTLACAYSPRAVPGAPVSMPIDWAELDRVYPTDFTISNASERLAAVGDVWAEMSRHKNDLATL